MNMTAMDINKFTFIRKLCPSQMLRQLTGFSIKVYSVYTSCVSWCYIQHIREVREGSCEKSGIFTGLLVSHIYSCASLLPNQLCSPSSQQATLSCSLRSYRYLTICMCCRYLKVLVKGKAWISLVCQLESNLFSQS